MSRLDQEPVGLKGADRDLCSELMRTIGVKGYHDTIYAGGIYPVGGGTG